jgi:2'-5' RNA ligase
VRLFFAAWPPPATAAALEQWARGCEGRVIPAANIHLTLAFLGEADPLKASAAARRVSGRAHALPLDEARYWRRERILWIGPRETPLALREVVDGLASELRREGFVLEERPFAAHVTLLRNAPPPKNAAPLPKVDWPIEELLLVRSSVSSKGASYEPVERFPLRAA